MVFFKNLISQNRFDMYYRVVVKLEEGGYLVRQSRNDNKEVSPQTPYNQ